MKDLKELMGEMNLQICGTSPDGGNGYIWRAGKMFASVVWSFGGGWDHVSIAPLKHSYTPSWDDMCRLKDMFFHKHETVVQYHPCEADYINNISNCLHIWRPQKEKLPIPPTFMVGLRPGQTMADAIREQREYYAKQNRR